MAVKCLARLCALLCTILLSAGSCFAVSVYGTNVDPLNYTGTRSIGSGLVGNANYDNSDFSVSWEIVNLMNGTFQYTYTIDGFEGLMGGGVSHFTLDLSDDYDNMTVQNATLNGHTIDSEDIEFGDFNEPSNNPTFMIVGAVKFDLGGDADPLVYSFVSNRVPVWHHAFFKAGNPNYAYTAGLNDPDSMNILDFLPSPNSEQPGQGIPEPVSAVLLGLGLAAFELRRRAS